MIYFIGVVFAYLHTQNQKAHIRNEHKTNADFRWKLMPSNKKCPKPTIDSMYRNQFTYHEIMNTEKKNYRIKRIIKLNDSIESDIQVLSSAKNDESTQNSI